MENEKNKTIVDGQETGDYTESGNYIHASDGKFGSKRKSRPQKETLLERSDFLNKNFLLNTFREELEDEIGIHDENELMNYAKALLLYTHSPLTEKITHNDPSVKNYIKVLDQLLSKMELYRDDNLGKMAEFNFRGMSFVQGEIEEERKFDMFLSLKIGQELPTLKGIQSWTSDYEVADGFTNPDEEYNNVILICSNNKTGVGIQHISYFPNEKEILKPSYAKHIVKGKKMTEKYGSKYLIIEVEEE